MVHGPPPPRAWWPVGVSLALGLVGSAAVIGGVTLLVTGARDQPPAPSPPASTGPTISVIPDGP